MFAVKATDGETLDNAATLNEGVMNLLEIGWETDFIDTKVWLVVDEDNVVYATITPIVMNGVYSGYGYVVVMPHGTVETWKAVPHGEIYKPVKLGD